jgi:hypothetical protein
MIMRFEVIDIDISRGGRMDFNHCPLANCLHRSGLHRAMVGSVMIVLPTGSTMSVEVRIPDLVRMRISKFDVCGQMIPFSFELDIPQEALDWQEKRPKVLG